MLVQDKLNPNTTLQLRNTSVIKDSTSIRYWWGNLWNRLTEHRWTNYKCSSWPGTREQGLGTRKARGREKQLLPRSEKLCQKCHKKVAPWHNRSGLAQIEQICRRFKNGRHFHEKNQFWVAVIVFLCKYCMEVVCYVILNNLQTTINQNVELIICVEGREEKRVSSDEWCMEVPLSKMQVHPLLS